MKYISLIHPKNLEFQTEFLSRNQSQSYYNSQPVQVKGLELKEEGRVLCGVLVYSGH